MTASLPMDSLTRLCNTSFEKCSPHWRQPQVLSGPKRPCQRDFLHVVLGHFSRWEMSWGDWKGLLLKRAGEIWKERLYLPELPNQTLRRRSSRKGLRSTGCFPGMTVFTGVGGTLPSGQRLPRLLQPAHPTANVYLGSLFLPAQKCILSRQLSSLTLNSFSFSLTSSEETFLGPLKLGHLRRLSSLIEHPVCSLYSICDDFCLLCLVTCFCSVFSIRIQAPRGGELHLSCSPWYHQQLITLCLSHSNNSNKFCWVNDLSVAAQKVSSGGD